MRVRDVMTHRENLQVVNPRTGLSEVLRIMESGSLNQVPVVEGHRLVGWIDRDRLLRTVRLYMEVGR